MKTRLIYPNLTWIFLLFCGLFVLGATNVLAQSQTGWTGASDGNWSNAGNWTNGIPNSGSPAARILNFGPGGNAHPNSTNDMNAVSGHRIFFNSGATGYTLYLNSGGVGTTLNDFSQNQPAIQNDSSVLQTVDMAFKMQAKGVTLAANQAANINPTSGDIVFTTNCAITLLQNTQLRFFSTSGHTVSFYGPLLQGSGFANGLAMLTTGSGGTGASVVFYNTNSCSNSVISCGTLRLATNNVTVTPILLGDTSSAIAPPAILQMDNGCSNSSPLVIQFPQPALTNSKTIGNTVFGTGLAQFTGPVSLGTNLTMLANAAGTLEFDGNFDFQNPGGLSPRVITVAGAGNTVITGTFTNASTGSSVLVKTNSGTLTLAGIPNAVRILYNLGGGVISITNAGAIGVPAGVNYPDKFNFTANAALRVTNSFTLGRNAGGADNAGFRIFGGSTGTFDVTSGSTLTLDGPVIDIPGSGSGNLAKSSSGKLVLQQPNTYSGNTIVSNGVLALSGGVSISNSPNLIFAAGATFDVSALASFSLASGQTITANGATVTLAGNVNLNAGSLLLKYTNGVPTLQIANGAVNFNNSTVTVTVVGPALPAGSYKLIAAGAGGSVSGTVASSSLTVNGAGYSGGAQIKLQIASGELYLIVNHAPSAATMTSTRNAGVTTLKIALSDVATNWTDVDGDTVSFVSVGTSTNGITVTTNGGFLLYSNVNNVNDQFSYVITDPAGATATGVVNIVVNQGISGQVQSFGVIGGSPTLSFAGIPGYGYSVQRSTNLPVWVTIWTTNAPANGLFNFTDDFSDLGGMPPASAFYRLSWQP